MPESSNKKVGEGQVRIQNVFFDVKSDTMLILLKGKKVLVRNISDYPFLKGASLEALQDYTLSYKGIYWAYFAQILRIKELIAEEEEKAEKELEMEFEEEVRVKRNFQEASPRPKKPKPRRERIRKESNNANDPLHGVRLSDMLEYLVEEQGWEKLGEKIRVRCFTHDPSIKSSLKFLRKTDWARTKVERMYLKSIRAN